MHTMPKEPSAAGVAGRRRYFNLRYNAKGNVQKIVRRLYFSSAA
jgi:hypothetical protein